VKPDRGHRFSAGLSAGGGGSVHSVTAAGLTEGEIWDMNKAFVRALDRAGIPHGRTATLAWKSTVVGIEAP
jgi:hypothetical protein